MILPNSYETILDKIKQDWFTAGWEACKEEATNFRHMGLWFEEHQNRAPQIPTVKGKKYV